MHDSTVAVIGLGYVGLPLAVLAKEKGWNVIGLDIDEEKIEKINQRVVPFEDEDLQSQIEKHPITASSDFEKIKEASIIVIAVPTPVTSTNEPNLAPLKGALKSIQPHIMSGQTIVIESTINPGVMDEVVKPTIPQDAGIGIVHCPERVNPGDATWSVRNIPRVLGAYDDFGARQALNFYESILEASVKVMQSPTEAEAVKILENTFRDVNIAFVNEMARSFDKLGIDIVHVIEGASTKPFGFMAHYPGSGVGGHCISVDPYYMIERGRQAGFNHEFLKLARKINEDMPAYTISRLKEAIKELQGADDKLPIALLGITYKKNVSDMRNSPALKILDILRENGYDTAVYDPHVPEKSTVSSLFEALSHAQVLLIGCDHDDIVEQLSPELLIENNIKIVIDGKNSLTPSDITSAGIVYRGIGR